MWVNYRRAEMNIYIWEDEAYPVYGLDERSGDYTVEIPDELYERYMNVMKLYRAMQEELAKYYAVHN